MTRWRPHARTALRLLVRAALLLLLAVECAYPFREPLLGGVLRAQLTQAVARALGGTLQLGTLDGDWLRHLRCRDVAYAGDGALRAVRGASVEVWLDPLRLLRGDLGGVRALRLTATAVELDLDAAAGGSGAAATPVDAALAQRLASLCPAGACLDVTRLSVRTRHGTWAGAVAVVLAPADAAVPRRQLELAAPQLSARARWRPDADFDLHLQCGDPRPWLTLLGAALPAGVTPGPCQLALTARDRALTAQLTAHAELPPWDGAGGAAQLAATVRADATRVDLTRLQLELPALRLDGTGALAVGLPALATPGAVGGAPLTLDAELSRVDLDRLTLPQLGPTPRRGAVAGHVALRGTLLQPHPELELQATLPRVVVGDAPPVAVRARVHVDPRTLQVEDLHLVAGDQELSAQATVAAPQSWWQVPEGARFTLRASSPQGSMLRAEGDADRRRLHAADVTLAVPGLTARATGIRLRWTAAHVAAVLDATPGATLTVELNDLAAARAALPPVLPAWVAALPADLTLNARAALFPGWLDVLQCDAATAGLALYTAPAQVPLAGAGAAGSTALWLTCTGPLPVTPPAPLPQVRSAFAALTLRGGPDRGHGQVALDLHLHDATRSGRALGTVAFGWQDGLCLAPDLTLVTTGPEAAGLATVTGAAALDAALVPRGVDLVTTWDGTVTAAGAAPVHAHATLHADGQRIGSELSVTQDRLRLAGAPMLLGGTAADLVRGPAALCAAPLAGTLRADALDLAPFAARVPGIADLGGNADAELVLAGTLAQPAPRLEATVRDGFLRVGGLPRLEQIQARLTATPAAVQITELRFNSGLGPVTAHGSVTLPDRSGGDGQVALWVRGQDVLLYRRGGIRVRGDLDLTAAGPLSATQVTGRIDLHAGRYLAHIPYWDPTRSGGEAAIAGLLLEGPRLRPWARVQLDVALQTREPFAIDTNVLKTRASAALRLVGPLEAPRLMGDVTASQGTLTLPGLPLTVQSLLVHLDRDRPRFPAVTLQAQGRRHGHDVALRVHGGLDDPEIVLSATPPLTPEQLAVLVTTGAAPGASDRDRLRGAGTALGSYLVTEIADYLFGSESTEAKESFLSRLRVETGTEVSRNGNETILAEFRLFDRLYLQGERDIYNQMNLGLVYRLKFR